MEDFKNSADEYRRKISKVYLLSQFAEQITWCFNVSCPIMRTRSRRSKPNLWIPNEIIKESKGLREMFLLISTSRTMDPMLDYKNKMKEHNSNIKKEKIF